MDTIVLFDLEETLIESWENPRLLHEENPSIQKWLSTLGAFQSGLLSFAVWDEKDLNTFNKTLREPLEKTFGIEFSDPLMFIKTDLLIKNRVWENKPFLDMNDFDDFFKKDTTMFALWKNEFQRPNTRVILLDDKVLNTSFKALDVENCELQTINPLSNWFKTTFV